MMTSQMHDHLTLGNAIIPFQQGLYLPKLDVRIGNYPRNRNQGQTNMKGTDDIIIVRSHDYEKNL